MQVFFYHSSGVCSSFHSHCHQDFRHQPSVQVTVWSPCSAPCLFLLWLGLHLPPDQLTSTLPLIDTLLLPGIQGLCVEYGLAPPFQLHLPIIQQLPPNSTRTIDNSSWVLSPGDLAQLPLYHLSSLLPSLRIQLKSFHFCMPSFRPHVFREDFFLMNFCNSIS